MIDTIVPIELKNLKKYFEDKTETYNIDYIGSKLKGAQFLTYISNLDIPCDISNYDDELLLAYFETQMLVNIPMLERVAMQVLFEHKGLIKNVVHGAFISQNLEIIEQWANKLESLPLYNMSIIGEGAFKDFVDSYPKDDSNDVKGINFVSLLKHKDFYFYYNKSNEKNVRYYTKYFTEYMFKGKSLFDYWGVKENPMFLMTWAVAEGKFDTKKYNEAKKADIGNLNATPV
jgi:hypothetical protein